MKKQTKKTKVKEPKTYSVRFANSENAIREYIFQDSYDAWEFYHRVASVLEFIGENYAWVGTPVEK